MLLLSTLLTALARKTGDFLQALFGWSVAALFGRLHRSQRISVTIALVLSLFWPVFVVGTFFPAAATWFISFVPIESPTVKSVLRGVWLVLALSAPAVVGALVRLAVPLGARKSMAASMLHGYPLALGMALSFLVTLITVPLVKLSSIARRWEEEHIYVQPREGRYRDVLKHLVTACEASQLIPTVERVPDALALSTHVLRFFSRGAIDTLLVLEPRRVVCEGLELSLYPADLLLRGTPDRVAHVRARLTATLLERDAYLVQDPKAQELQDELGRLWDALQRHAFPEQAVDGLESRLEATVRTAISARSIPFDEWLTIDRIARRFEAALHGQHSRIDAMASEALVAAHTLPAAKTQLNISVSSRCSLHWRMSLVSSFSSRPSSQRKRRSRRWARRCARS